jgi:hypothetical protein
MEERSNYIDRIIQNKGEVSKRLNVVSSKQAQPTEKCHIQPILKALLGCEKSWLHPWQQLQL